MRGKKRTKYFHYLLSSLWNICNFLSYNFKFKNLRVTEYFFVKKFFKFLPSLSLWINGTQLINLINLIQTELSRIHEILFSRNYGIGCLTCILYIFLHGNAQTSTTMILGGPDKIFLNSVINRSVPFHCKTQDASHRGHVERESYLYGGVIFIHKVVLDELDGKCTLAHASCSHHHQLVLCHFCRRSSPLTITHVTSREKRGSRQRCRLVI